MHKFLFFESKFLRIWIRCANIKKMRVLGAILKQISLVDFGPKKYLPKVAGTRKYLSEKVGLKNYLS